MTQGKHRGDGTVAPAPQQDAQTGGLQQRSEGGVGDFVKVSGNLAKAAGAITRRLTVDLAGAAATAGKDIIEGAQQGKSSSEIASTVMNDWIDGARKVLGFDEELQRMGEELKAASKPVMSYMPAPVKEVVEQVSTIAPIRAVTDITGMSVTDVRANLRKEGLALLRRSAALDDPDEHPAMSVILKEVSPDEARIVRFLGTEGPQAVIDVIASNPWTRKKREMLHNFSIIGLEAALLRPELCTIYMNNLERLGLVSVRPYRLRSQRNYDLLLCQGEVMSIKKPKGRLVRLKKRYKGVELSDFGREVFKHCLETERWKLAAVPDEL